MYLYMCVCAYVMVGGGVPVAWHSSSRTLLTMTVISVILSAPSTAGGTETQETMSSHHIVFFLLHSETMTITNQIKPS